MYTAFYGLREKPFSLSPDPRYLYLADSHREALAHLLYGIEQGEGFIAVTGEVGTGKTTLCRTLLQRIEPGTEVAFIFNPQLSPLELLQAIGTELGLESAGSSRRDLIEELNRFLLEKKADGRRVLLIIDEAQNLPPETLEQVRLLSNLETDTSKLVQIVLIGQPELDDLLESPHLRQLRQRISVRWRLSALSAAETRDYVRHRLRIAAGAPRELFSDLALREIHRRANGIPRVINLLCDRALLAGYAAGARSIGLGLVADTDREIRGGGRERSREGRRVAPLRWAALAAVVLLAGAALGAFATRERAAWLEWLARPAGAAERGLADLWAAFFPSGGLPQVASAPAPAAVSAAPLDLAAVAPEPTRGFDALAATQAAPAPAALAPLLADDTVVAAPEPAPSDAAASLPLDADAVAVPSVASDPPAPAEPVPAPVVEAPVAELPVAEPIFEADLPTALARTAPAATLASSVDALLESWGQQASGAELLTPTQAQLLLAQRGLDVLALRDADLDDLRFFDRPALVELLALDGTTRTVLLVRLQGENVWLAGLDPARRAAVAEDALRTHGVGTAWVAWRDFEALPPVLAEGHSGAPVSWLQSALGSLGFYQEPPTGEFDGPTVLAVRAFQESRRLVADGAVGPMTKMALYEALGRYERPHLEERG